MGESSRDGSHLSGMSDEMRDYIKRSAAEAPPLNEHQKAVIRAAFADTDWTQLGKDR